MFSHIRVSDEEPEFFQALVDSSPPFLLHQRLPRLRQKQQQQRPLPLDQRRLLGVTLIQDPLTFLSDSSPSPLSVPSALLRSGAMLVLQPGAGRAEVQRAARGGGADGPETRPRRGSYMLIYM